MYTKVVLETIELQSLQSNRLFFLLRKQERDLVCACLQKKIFLCVVPPGAPPGGRPNKICGSSYLSEIYHQLIQQTKGVGTGPGCI